MVSKDTEKSYNFLINASNQANMAGISNHSSLQLNAIFFFISPYYIEKFKLEGLDLDFKVDEKGVIWINNVPFEAREVQPGIKVLGIIKR